MKKKRSRYTAQVKAEVMRAVETRGQRMIAEVVKGLGRSDQLVHSWKSKVKAETAHSDRGETTEQELRRLRREFSDVKKHRDVLVKSICRRRDGMEVSVLDHIRAEASTIRPEDTRPLATSARCNTSERQRQAQPEN